MVCQSKMIDEEDPAMVDYHQYIHKVDMEDLFCQTSHLDKRRLLTDGKGKPVERQPIVDFVTDLFWGEIKINDKVVSIKTKHDFTKVTQELARIHSVKPSYVSINYIYKCLLQESYKIADETNTEPKRTRNPVIEKFIKSKSARDTDGIRQITLDFDGHKGFISGNGGCEWDCDYCPKEPDMPRSYLKKEPAVARAAANDFDAYKQIIDRCSVLSLMGYEIDKIDLTIQGGTFSSFDKDYVREFMRDCYYSFNVFYQPEETRRMERLSLEDEMKINELSYCKVIGVSLETRPDCVERDLLFFREVGCTRIQIGVQHTYDHILKKSNRGCYDNDTIKAIKLLKDACFKVEIHLMPDLPGSNPYLDKMMFDTMLYCQHHQPDYVKIYPCQTTDFTRIKEKFENTIQKFETYLTKNGYDVKISQSKNYTVFVVYSDINGTKKELENSEVDELYCQFCINTQTTYCVPDHLRNININDYFNNMDGYESDNSIDIFDDEIEYTYDLDETTEHFKKFLKYHQIEYDDLTPRAVSHWLKEFYKQANPEYYVPYTHDFKPAKDLKSSNLRKLIDVCKVYKSQVQEWIRISRVVRDIPNDYIAAGLDRADLRQVIQNELTAEGTPCQCIRCRDIKKQESAHIDDIDIVSRVYEASDGIEYFLSVEDNKNNLYGFLRLRLSQNPGIGLFPELEDSALIRELHVYGKMTASWDKHLVSADNKHVQHRGFGQKLVKTAEMIARKHGYNKTAIIAGNSVRKYYEKYLGYTLEGTYMTKILSPYSIFSSNVVDTTTLLNWKNQQWAIVATNPNTSKIYITPKTSEVDPYVMMTTYQKMKYIIVLNDNNDNILLMGIVLAIFFVIKKMIEMMLTKLIL